MTEMIDHPTNRVIVIGALDAVREGKKEVAVSDGRNRTGGLLDRFTLQLTSPYGEAFALPLTATGGVRGLELLEQATIGQTVVVEGIARLYLDIDQRYATQPDDRGRSYREMRLSVSAVRERRDDEPVVGSFVWLDGIVAEPPRVIRHPNVPDLELATTLLTVEVAEKTSYPGSRMLMRSTYQVPVMIPLTDPQAGLLYKQGNHIRVEGQFDRTIVPQRGQAVNVRLAELDAAFQTEVESLRGQVKIDAERRYRRNRRNLMEAPRATVLIGFLEAVEAEAIDLATAQQERNVFASQQRAERQERYRASQNRQSVSQQRMAPPVEITNGVVEESTTDEALTTQLTVAHVEVMNVVVEESTTDEALAIRPRRRPREEALVGALNGSEDS